MRTNVVLVYCMLQLPEQSRLWCGQHAAHTVQLTQHLTWRSQRCYLHGGGARDYGGRGNGRSTDPRRGVPVSELPTRAPKFSCKFSWDGLSVSTGTCVRMTLQTSGRLHCALLAVCGTDSHVSSCVQSIMHIVRPNMHVRFHMSARAGGRRAVTRPAPTL